MNKNLSLFLLLAILISACASSNSAPTAANTPTPGVTLSAPTPTATALPPSATSTPTTTPTPTLSLPVGFQTAVPSSNKKINSASVKDLQEIARYYGKIKYNARVTRDKKILLILDPEGITKYDYASMQRLAQVTLANQVSDFQMSSDGGMMIIDNKWLLDLKNDQEPVISVLTEKIHLLNFYSQIFSLAPDGTKIAVEQVKCKDLCEHILRMVSTQDFSDVYTSGAPTYQDQPTFSGDGKYFAVADLIIEAHADGSTNPAGASVSISTGKDLAKVSSLNINFPFYVFGMAFSEDNALLAIAQTNTIDIFDVQSGAIKVTIADLCKAGSRKVMFAPSAKFRILESSDCGSSEWAITDSTARVSPGKAPDLSRIDFDEKGNFKHIPYPQHGNPDLWAHYQENYFTFLNDDMLGFKYSNPETSDRHPCDLSLNSGALDCQTNLLEYNNERYLVKDTILAKDGKYYRYVAGKTQVDIYSFDDPAQVYIRSLFGITCLRFWPWIPKMVSFFTTHGQMQIIPNPLSRI